MHVKNSEYLTVFRKINHGLDNIYFFVIWPMPKIYIQFSRQPVDGWLVVFGLTVL